ncbi:MAG: hypothetical protein AAF674_15685 [Pseudomonadota bacterium]
MMDGGANKPAENVVATENETAQAAPAEAPDVDPAIAAVRNWEAAQMAESYYFSAAQLGWDECSYAQALNAATHAAYLEMTQVRPTTLEGLSLLVRAWAFDRIAYRAGAKITRPYTWADNLGEWHDKRDAALLINIMSFAEEQP